MLVCDRCLPHRVPIVRCWKWIFRGLEYVLNQDMVVDTTLVGTVLNGLSQVSVMT